MTGAGPGPRKRAQTRTGPGQPQSLDASVTAVEQFYDAEEQQQPQAHLDGGAQVDVPAVELPAVEFPAVLAQADAPADAAEGSEAGSWSSELVEYPESAAGSWSTELAAGSEAGSWSTELVEGSEAGSWSTELVDYPDPLPFPVIHGPSATYDELREFVKDLTKDADVEYEHTSPTLHAEPPEDWPYVDLTPEPPTLAASPSAVEEDAQNGSGVDAEPLRENIDGNSGLQHEVVRTPVFEVPVAEVASIIDFDDDPAEGARIVSPM